MQQKWENNFKQTTWPRQHYTSTNEVQGMKKNDISHCIEEGIKVNLPVQIFE
jgi:hypothetical protein